MRGPVSLLLAVTALAVASTASMAAAQEVDETGEGEILARINAMRNAAQLGHLQRHDELDEAAEVHSADMAEHGQLAHVSERTGTPADRVSEAGLAPQALAENVAFAPDALEAHRQLVSSDAHRANMMNPRYTHVGISVMRVDGGVYVTEVFALLAQDAEDAEDEAEQPETVEPPPVVAPEAVAPWSDEQGAASPADAPPAPAPGGEVQAQPLPEAQAEQAPAIRAPAVQPGQRRVAGYWVYSNGHWWYYPLPPNAQPGQVLQPTHRASSPPPGVYNQPRYRVYQPSTGYRPGYRVYVAPRRAPAFGWSPRRHYYRWRYGR